jgi:hypothetical protein
MRKIFLLLFILVSVYTSDAQSVRNVVESSQLRNTQPSSVFTASDNLIENLNVYPNPVIDMLKVSFKSSRRSSTVISLFNNIGKQVFSQESLVEQGNNLISIDIRSKSIEPGIYFIQCVVEKEVFTRKLIVK